MSNEELKDNSISEVHDQPAFVFKPNEVHDWKQHGPYLICKSCEIMHATYVGMNRIIVGLNDKGQPLFKKRS